MAETKDEVQRFVRLYVTAWRQSRFWQCEGHGAWAATMRIKAKQFMRHARFRKAHPLEAEGPPGTPRSPAPAENPQPA